MARPNKFNPRNLPSPKELGYARGQRIRMTDEFGVEEGVVLRVDPHSFLLRFPTFDMRCHPSIREFAVIVP